MPEEAKSTVGDYLLHRLKQLGANHVFGVPGDYSLTFFQQIVKSELNYVGTCNELNAAYAADGYARLRGIGVAAVTYGVGEFSALNGIAGAFAERIPLVLLSGYPGRKNLRTQPLLHHTLGNYDKPISIMKHLTIDGALLDDPEMAPQLIDRVLRQCILHQGPGNQQCSH